VTNRRTLAAALTFAAVLSVVGCGPAGPKTYSVRGKLDLTGGDVAHLAGCNIEAAHESDPTVRASGSVQSDGRFTLETLHEGVILKGAQQGKYRVRLLLSDDGDAEARKLRRKAIHPRFLQFETTGLSLEVPPDSEVVLKVAAR
jgi:hypothetical protein